MKKSMYVVTDEGNAATLLASDSRNEFPYYVQLKGGKTAWFKSFEVITQEKYDSMPDYVEPTKAKPAAKKKATK